MVKFSLGRGPCPEVVFGKPLDLAAVVVVVHHVVGGEQLAGRVEQEHVPEGGHHDERAVLGTVGDVVFVELAGELADVGHEVRGAGGRTGVGRRQGGRVRGRGASTGDAVAAVVDGRPGAGAGQGGVTGRQGHRDEATPVHEAGERAAVLDSPTPEHLEVRAVHLVTRDHVVRDDVLVRRDRALSLLEGLAEHLVTRIEVLGGGVPGFHEELPGLAFRHGLAEDAGNFAGVEEHARLGSGVELADVVLEKQVVGNG